MTIKKYSTDFILYAVSTTISKAVPLLLVFLLSNYFRPSEYGNLSLVQVLIFVFTCFFGGEFCGGVSRKYFVSNIKNFSICVSTSLSSILVINAVVVIFVITYVHYVGNILSLNLFLCGIAVVCAALQSVLLILTTTLQMMEKPFRYFSVQVIYGVSYLILIIFSYYTDILTVPLFFLLQIVATIIAVVANICMINDIIKIKFKICKQEIRYLLAYSSPLIIYSFSSFFIVLYLRYTVKEVGGLYLVGLFAIAQQMGMLMSNADFVIGKVWTPYAFKLLAKDNIKQFFHSSFKVILLLFSIFLLLLIVNKLAFSFIISESYKGAEACSFIVLFSFFLKSVYSIFASYAYFYEKTIFVAFVNVSVAVFSLSFSKYALVHMSLIGGGISMVLSYFMLMSMVIIFIVFNSKNKVRRLSLVSQTKELEPVKI